MQGARRADAGAGPAAAWARPHRAERAHIHVRRDEREAKFWLEPVRLEWNRGFTMRELNVLEGLVQEHAETLVRAWREYFEARRLRSGSPGST